MRQMALRSSVDHLPASRLTPAVWSAGIPPRTVNILPPIESVLLLPVPDKEQPDPTPGVDQEPPDTVEGVVAPGTERNR